MADLSIRHTRLLAATGQQGLALSDHAEFPELRSQFDDLGVVRSLMGHLDFPVAEMAGQPTA